MAEETEEEGQFLLHWRVRVSHRPNAYTRLVEHGNRLKRSTRSWYRERITAESAFSLNILRGARGKMFGYQEAGPDGWYPGLVGYY